MKSGRETGGNVKEKKVNGKSNARAKYMEKDGKEQKLGEECKVGEE
jgi:hypothetical protein